MKNVLDKCKANSQDYWHPDFLKLRLRGSGSGFKEGPEQQESNEPLHLCISAKNPQVYKDAQYLVEQLLNKIYKEFLVFIKKSD
jgi:hypothetical protein